MCLVYDLFKGIVNLSATLSYSELAEENNGKCIAWWCISHHSCQSLCVRGKDFIKLWTLVNMFFSQCHSARTMWLERCRTSCNSKSQDQDRTQNTIYRINAALASGDLKLVKNAINYSSDNLWSTTTTNIKDMVGNVDGNLLWEMVIAPEFVSTAQALVLKMLTLVNICFS